MAKGFRFVVGRSGDIQSSIWRIWSNKDDLYLATRSVAGLMKVSFHASGVYRNAVVSRIPRAPIYKWKRPKETDPGITPIFDIVVPAFSVEDRLSEALPSEKPVTFICPPAVGSKIIIRIFLARKSITRGDLLYFARGRSVSFVGTVELRHERAWVVSYTDRFSATELKFVENLVSTTKINLKPGSREESISHAFLHSFEQGLKPPAIVDIQLGKANIYAPSQKGSEHGKGSGQIP